jgi:GxxExxY protein
VLETGFLEVFGWSVKLQLGRNMPSVLSQRINTATSVVIAAAIKVHKALGPGLLESTYTVCLLYELRRCDCHVESQKAVPILYEDVSLDCGYRLDMVVNDLVVVELKAIDRFAPIHTAQMLTCLKLTGYPVGLLINFNVPLLKQGIKRLLNPRPGTKFLRGSPEASKRSSANRADSVVNLPLPSVTPVNSASIHPNNRPNSRSISPVTLLVTGLDTPTMLLIIGH